MGSTPTHWVHCFNWHCDATELKCTFNVDTIAGTLESFEADFILVSGVDPQTYLVELLDGWGSNWLDGLCDSLATSGAQGTLYATPGAETDRMLIDVAGPVQFFVNSGVSGAKGSFKLFVRR